MTLSEAFSIDLQLQQGCFGLASVKIDGVLVVVKTLLARVFVSGVVDQMEEVDKGSHRHQELSFSQGNSLTGKLHLHRTALVPSFSAKAFDFHKHISIFLMVPCQQIGSAVRQQPEQTHSWIALSLAHIKEFPCIRWAYLRNDCFQFLKAGIEERPIRKRESFDEGERFTGLNAIVPFIELCPSLQNHMHPRLVLQQRMSDHLALNLVIVDPVINDDLSDSSTLHYSYMVEPLLVNHFGLNQAQEVPLGQHSQLSHIARPHHSRSSPHCQPLLLLQRALRPVDISESAFYNSSGEFVFRKFELIIIEELLVEDVIGVLAQFGEGIRVFAVLA